MSCVNNSENNQQANNNISNNPNMNNQSNMSQNGQILYDQYGNPVAVPPANNYQNQVPPQVVQPAPQVVKQVERKEGPTKVVYQQVPSQMPPPSVPPKQPDNHPEGSNKTGRWRYILLILFFVALLALIWFLPDIRKYVTEKEAQNQEEIIHGTLKCVYEEEDDFITTLYTSEFRVENNKVKAYTSLIETKGDTGSEETLTKLNNECEELTRLVKNIPGIKSSCSLNSRKQMNKQEIDYAKVNTKKLTSAYSEAGGIVPDYELDQDARQIKKEMILSRYSCTVN